MIEPLIPVIVVNLAAGHGTAQKKWQRIKEVVLDQFPDFYLYEYRPPFDLEKTIRSCIAESQPNCFLYAGGDGTMNWLLNTIMEIDQFQPGSFYFGGLGLGSSNDFQKPYGQFIHEIPTRLQTDNSRLSDIGWVKFMEADGKPQQKYFLINCSLGVTAAANLTFNREDAILRRIKPIAVDPAIIYTALKTIFMHKNNSVQLVYSGATRQIELSNAAILKMPNISGSFRYSQEIQPDDGRLGVNLCVNMSKWELVRTLQGLSAGHFGTQAKQESFFTTSLRVTSHEFIPLETDGEVYLAKDIEFGILPQHIKLLNT